MITVADVLKNARASKVKIDIALILLAMYDTEVSKHLKYVIYPTALGDAINLGLLSQNKDSIKMTEKGKKVYDEIFGIDENLFIRSYQQLAKVWPASTVRRDGKRYPLRHTSKKTQASYCNALRGGVKHEDVLKAAKKYLEDTNPAYYKKLHNWIADEMWNAYIEMEEEIDDKKDVTTYGADLI